MASKAGLPLAVYGTLLDAEVRQMVLGPCGVSGATLAGWDRVYVAGAIYPAVRERADAETDVLVLEGLEPDAIARGDAFEGAEYQRRALPLTFTADGSRGEAMVYVPTLEVRLSNQPWTYDAAWRTAHLPVFLAMTRAAVADMRPVGRA